MLNSALIARILKYVFPYKLRLLIIFTSLIVVSTSIVLLGEAIKNFTNSDKINIGQINSSIAYIIGLIIIFGIGSFIRSFYVNFLAEQVISKIRMDVIKKLLELNITFYDSAKISEIMVKITNNCELVGNIVINILSFLIRNFIIALFGIAMMFYQSAILTFLTLFLFSIIVIPIVLFGKAVRRATKNTTETFNKISSEIDEVLTNIRLVYSFGQNHEVLDNISKENNSYLELNRKRTKLRSLFFSCAITGILLTIVFVIWIGTINIAKGNITSGSLIAFLFYSVTVSFSLGGIFEVLSEFQKYLTASEQIFEIIDCKSIENNNNLLKPDIKIDSINFNDVNFSYPTRPENVVLNNLNFSIKAGEIIGIVGKSGLGKSTLMNLLIKFYSLNSGSISINGINISDIETNYLRSLISVTPQEPYIFSSTIFDNIKFAKPESSDDEIECIAKLSLIDEFTSNFKDGLHTKIGNKGIQISGGQRQRIAIARSLIKNPEILILDEATNALDSLIEMKIFDNIKLLMKDKIIIMIGHRSKIMEQATKIFVIDQGNIIMSGTHDELLDKSPLYQKLAMEEN